MATAKRPRAVVLVVSGPVARAEIDALCERAGAALRTCDLGAVDCHVDGLAPDALTVEVLARLQLTALRLGRRISLRDASPQLRDLLEVLGLDRAIPCGRSALEPWGQPEQREQPLGVEEEGDGGDPSA